MFVPLCFLTANTMWPTTSHSQLQAFPTRKDLYPETANQKTSVLLCIALIRYCNITARKVTKTDGFSRSPVQPCDLSHRGIGQFAGIPTCLSVQEILIIIYILIQDKGNSSEIKICRILEVNHQSVHKLEIIASSLAMPKNISSLWQEKQKGRTS